MKIDIERLTQALSDVKAAETVSTGEVNAYLLNEVIRPLLQGVTLCYGDVDYSRFDIDDLRVAARYCENIGDMSYRLRGVIDNIAKARAKPCARRAFC